MTSSRSPISRFTRQDDGIAEDLTAREFDAHRIGAPGAVTEQTVRVGESTLRLKRVIRTASPLSILEAVAG